MGPTLFAILAGSGCIRRMAGAVFWGTYLCSQLSPAPRVDVTYHLAVGQPVRTVKTGTVWLYHYSWYGLERFRLAGIEDGRALIRLSADRIENEIRPHPNTTAYVVVLELPNRRWYRTADIPAEQILERFIPAIESLAAVAWGPAGRRTVVLPEQHCRRLVMLDENGNPVAGIRIPVSIYLYDENHCGAHTGLPLGTFETDALGQIEVMAPLVPLYLDTRFYEPGDLGPAGQMMDMHFGLRTTVQQDLTIKKTWNLRAETFTLRVRNGDGEPLTDLHLRHCLRTAECGANCGTIARSDVNGHLHLDFAPRLVQSLTLQSEGGRRYQLSDTELRRLFETHHLKITWQP